MLDEAYTVEYLETFRRELDEDADYIAFELENPLAAIELVDKVEESIARTANAPLVTKPYGTDVESGDVYYRINIGNFSVFYVVIKNVMEVRWFRYSRSQQPLKKYPRYNNSDPFHFKS